MLYLVDDLGRDCLLEYGLRCGVFNSALCDGRTRQCLLILLQRKNLYEQQDVLVLSRSCFHVLIFLLRIELLLERILPVSQE